MTAVRERADLLTLVLALGIVPLTWWLVFGWSWSRDIAGHDELASLHNLLSIRETMGKAVVAATVGAEGLPIEPGVQHIRADDPDEFADATARESGSTAESWRRGARSGRGALLLGSGQTAVRESLRGGRV